MGVVSRFILGGKYIMNTSRQEQILRNIESIMNEFRHNWVPDIYDDLVSGLEILGNGNGGSDNGARYIGSDLYNSHWLDERTNERFPQHKQQLTLDIVVYVKRVLMRYLRIQRNVTQELRGRINTIIGNINRFLNEYRVRNHMDEADYDIDILEDIDLVPPPSQGGKSKKARKSKRARKSKKGGKSKKARK